MQKKLIAIAVAGMLTAPLAMAQSNVTIYGIVDAGLNYQASHSGTFTAPADPAAGPLEVNKAKSRTGLDSGNQAGSRIGFRGTEDLGNGLRAGFVVEQGFTVDTSSLPNTNRQSFISLAGDFGTVAAGLQWSPQHNMQARIDPFGLGAPGRMDNVYARNGNLQNTVAYVSPNFNGLSVVVAYSFNGTGDEVAKKDGNVKVWAISPRYTNGPINVEANWHQLKSDATGAKAEKVWDLGGTYDFGAAKVHAMYGQRKQSGRTLTAPEIAAGELLLDAFDGDPISATQLTAGIAALNKGVGIDNRYWMVGASAPVGEAGTFKISYTQGKWKKWDSKATQWAVGYDHRLSARTNVYAGYAKRGSDYGVADTRGQLTAAGQYKSQFALGLRHTF